MLFLLPREPTNPFMKSYMNQTNFFCYESLDFAKATLNDNIMRGFLDLCQIS